MLLYRISDCNHINDLSGRGASLYGGRWNSKGVYVVYTAESRALALAEAIVHMGRTPDKAYCIATIEIPDDSTQIFPADKLPPNWDEHPSPDYLKAIGDNFIKSGKYLALRMPSALVTEENNYLLNPAHHEFKKVKIVSQRTINVGRFFHA